MKKKIYIAVLSLALACTAFGCGKKEEDPKVKIQQDVMNFVNEELPAISSDRDNAISVYNTYFNTEDLDIKKFLNDLQTTAIPNMETYIDNLSAVETNTDEVEELKSLYLQCAQKQCDAMKMVASAIEEENPEFLIQANTMIDEASGFLTQYESKLRLMTIENDIEVNGTFNSAPAGSTGGTSEAPEDVAE